MQQDFLDFFDGHAVGQCTFDVQLDFSGTVERGQHGEVKHAAGLAAQAVAGPGIAPAPFGGDVLESHRKVIGFGNGAVHVISA